MVINAISRLIHYISRLISWPSRLMSNLTVSFSGSVFRFDLNSGFLYSEAVIVRIDEVCLGLGEFYCLQITHWWWLSMYFNEFVIPKGVIHLGERFVREV